SSLPPCRASRAVRRIDTFTLVVSLSNHEPNRLVLRQAQDERVYRTIWRSTLVVARLSSRLHTPTPIAPRAFRATGSWTLPRVAARVVCCSIRSTRTDVGCARSLHPPI